MKTMDPVKYGYSNTRVKAMEAKLLGGESMQSILGAKDVGTVLSTLVNTDYNKALIEYGGIQIKQSMIDFALSRNLAERMGALVRITPRSSQGIVRRLVGRFDLSNIKLAIEAKERHAPYEELSRYLIDYGEYNQQRMKETYKEETVLALMNRLAKGSHYADILRAAIEAYNAKKNALDAVAAIDAEYYDSYGKLMDQMKKSTGTDGKLLKMELDMRNVITLVRLKRRHAQPKDIESLLLAHGNIRIDKLKEAYASSANVEALVRALNVPGLGEGLEGYKKTGQLLSLEIGMRNSIFNASLRRLRGSVLSFKALVAYIYLKEMEVFALRVLIKGKAYNLGKDEIARLITWKID